MAPLNCGSHFKIVMVDNPIRASKAGKRLWRLPAFLLKIEPYAVPGDKKAMPLCRNDEPYKNRGIPIQINVQFLSVLFLENPVKIKILLSLELLLRASFAKAGRLPI